MTTLNDREKALENKHAYDEELLFKAYSRRTRLLGVWAASKLGKNAADADTYAQALVASSVGAKREEADAAIVARISADFASANVAVSEAEIRSEMDVLLATARAQLAGDKV